MTTPTPSNAPPRTEIVAVRTPRNLLFWRTPPFKKGDVLQIAKWKTTKYHPTPCIILHEFPECACNPTLFRLLDLSGLENLLTEAELV